MRNIVLILIVLVISTDGFPQNVRTTSSILQLERKLDSLSKQVKELHQFTLQQKNETVIKIDSLNKIADILHLPASPLEKWATPLIALFTIVVSSFTAYGIAVRQIKGQRDTTDVQKRLQESIAQDQLRVAREQINETSKMTLAQVKANNVSQARITWIQDLRELLCKYIAEVDIISFYILELQNFRAQQKEDEVQVIYQAMPPKIKAAGELQSKILMFLNSQDEDHQELERLIEKFMIMAFEYRENINKFEFKKNLNEIIFVSKKILKDTWEQAKNEGQV